MPADSIRRGEGLKPLRAGAMGQGFCTFFFREKRKKNQERKAVMPADSIRRGKFGKKEAWSQGTGLDRAGTLVGWQAEVEWR